MCADGRFLSCFQYTRKAWHRGRWRGSGVRHDGRFDRGHYAALTIPNLQPDLQPNLSSDLQPNLQLNPEVRHEFH
jgi:hypothetical protein